METDHLKVISEIMWQTLESYSLLLQCVHGHYKPYSFETGCLRTFIIACLRDSSLVKTANNLDQWLNEIQVNHTNS